MSRSPLRSFLSLIIVALMFLLQAVLFYFIAGGQNRKSGDLLAKTKGM